MWGQCLSPSDWRLHSTVLGSISCMCWGVWGRKVCWDEYLTPIHNRKSQLKLLLSYWCLLVLPMELIQNVFVMALVELVEMFKKASEWASNQAENWARSTVLTSLVLFFVNVDVPWVSISWATLPHTELAIMWFIPSSIIISRYIGRSKNIQYLLTALFQIDFRTWTQLLKFSKCLPFC